MGEQKESQLKSFFEQLQEMPLDDFAKQLEDNIPNHFDKYTEPDGKTTKFSVEKVSACLQKANVVEAKKKLLLLLMGRVDNYTWNDGMFLRNDKISKDILEFLMPKMKSDDYEVL